MKKNLCKTGKEGFTLLELLIALVMLTSILVMGGSFVKKKDNVIKKTFRQLIALNRQLDHFARLNRDAYRLVINIDEKNNSWWVEKKTHENLIQSKSPKPENLTSSSTVFVMDDRFSKKPQKLPGQLRFESLELSEQDAPVTSGKAYIYYLPEGQFNTALLKIKGKKVYWSLFIDRLHGELTVFNGKKSLQEFKQAL